MKYSMPPGQSGNTSQNIIMDLNQTVRLTDWKSEKHILDKTCCKVQRATEEKFKERNFHFKDEDRSVV